MLRDLEGFENIASDTAFSKRFLFGSVGWGSIPGRFTGSRGLNSASFRHTYDNQQTWIFGIAFNPSGSGQNPILEFRDGGINGTVQCYIQGGYDRKISVCRGDGTVLGKSDYLFLSGVWYHLQVKVVISNSGSVEIRLNGSSTPLLKLTNIDTSWTANQYADSFNWVGTWASLIDDFYLCDGQGLNNNDFLGDKRVYRLGVTGAGSYAQLTPSAGSNFENVDDAVGSDPDFDSTYNAGISAGLKDTFQTEDLPLLTSGIVGVRTVAWMRKDDAGARAAAPYRKSGATEGAGTTVDLPDTYIPLAQIDETDPNTGSSWTVAGMNALEPGAIIQS